MVKILGGIMRKNIGICKFCGQEKQLCKAHIIPQAFYKDLNIGPYFLASKGKYAKKLPIGEYDNTILCAECDRRIGLYDEYASRLFLKELENFKVSHINLYTIPKTHLDYTKLRKFIVSLIWRASISTKFTEVNLGDYENIALQLLKEEIPDDGKYFTTLITKYSGEYFLLNGSTFVMKFRIDNTIGYHFVINGLFIDIIPSNKPFINGLKSFKEYSLKNADLHIIASPNEIVKSDKLTLQFLASYDPLKKFWK